ncbi:zinc finger BED domain-containing protein 4-like [Zophobas morio]|uniref:zinc finger BED domain-containing protein 4-like n=2 Tax=Zophobas morio TaxID=2755281 RepID=UPI00308341E3
MNAKITNALIYMITVDHLPLSFTERKGFQYFKKVALPLYKAPGRSTITRQVDEKYTVLSSKIKDKFKLVDNFCLTTDAWTDSLNNRSFLGLTVHYLQETELKSITIGVFLLENKHTYDYIGTTLLHCCHEWNISKDKITAVITDNAGNMVKAVHEFFGSKKHLPCFAHTTNLIVTNSLKDVNNIISSVKAIVTFFKTSHDAAQKLRTYQIQNGKTEGSCLKLIQDISTRWNSTYYMLKRFLELAPLISIILFDNQNIKMIDQENIAILKELILVLAPFEAMTVEMSGQNYVTSSKVIPIVHCLKLTLDKVEVSTNVVKQILNKLKEEVARRFYSDNSSVEKNNLLSVSTILDPRFKRIHFENPLADTAAVARIKVLIDEHKKNDSVSVSPRNYDKNQEKLTDMTSTGLNLWAVHDKLSIKQNEGVCNNSGIPSELKNYLNQTLSSRTEDPIKFWTSVKHVYPYLSKIALKHLSILATSVPSERLFSKAGINLSELRNRLASKRLSALLFLGSLEEDEWHLNN